MIRNRSVRLSLCLGALIASGCAQSFKLNRFTTNESLFRAALEQYRLKKWDNAVQAFEKLTFELPARDTLLPVSHFYLAKSHAGKGDHLLAAQAYARLSESFATDTLADDALFQAAREYQALWRKPVLDSEYGAEAITQYQTLLALYPDTDLKAEAEKQIRTLQEWFASKDFANAMYYFRRKAYDPALVYFRDVVRLYPETEKARESLIRMAQAYDAIKWKEDKAEVCKTIKEKYPTDRDGQAICSGIAPADSTKLNTH